MSVWISRHWINALYNSPASPSAFPHVRNLSWSICRTLRAEGRAVVGKWTKALRNTFQTCKLCLTNLIWKLKCQCRLIVVFSRSTKITELHNHPILFQLVALSQFRNIYVHQGGNVTYSTLIFPIRIARTEGPSETAPCYLLGQIKGVDHVH